MSFAGLEKYKPKLGSNEPELAMLRDIFKTNIQIGGIIGIALAGFIFMIGVMIIGQF